MGACLTAGITEELVFRGLIMEVLRKRWNKYVGVVAPSLVFGLIHVMNIDSPNFLDVVLLAVAGTSVGIMFSVIAYQSGSIWASALVHGIWNLIIIGNILNIGTEPSGLFTYTLHSDLFFLTGGNFGIEAALPALIGYILVIVLAILLPQRKSGKEA